MAQDTAYEVVKHYPIRGWTIATSTTPAAELFTVSEGKISESVLIFDRLSYGPPGQD